MDYNEPSDIQKLKIIDKISLEDLEHFMSIWRTQTLVKILIQGNIMKDMAVTISQSILGILKVDKIEEVRNIDFSIDFQSNLTIT